MKIIKEIFLIAALKQMLGCDSYESRPISAFISILMFESKNPVFGHSKQTSKCQSVLFNYFFVMRSIGILKRLKFRIP